MDERSLIQLLKAELDSEDRGQVQLGIGDDAAVLKLRGNAVWSIDDSIEGVHFDLRWLSLRQAASRAVHAAASDLAAMGAMPVAALSSVQCPSSLKTTQMRAIARGQRQASAELGLPIVGGNLARGECIRFTTSVLGTAQKPCTRAGARPGDQVWLVGEVGLAGCGLALLQRQAVERVSSRADKAAVSACIRAWREPRALIEAGQQLQTHASSLIDVSDGVAGDAAQLAERSEVRIELDEAALRGAMSPALVRAAQLLDEDPLRFVLFGGEDYALLATGKERKRPGEAKVLGRVSSGSPEVRLVAEGREPTRLDGSFDHFRR